MSSERVGELLFQIRQLPQAEQWEIVCGLLAELAPEHDAFIDSLREEPTMDGCTTTKR